MADVALTVAEFVASLGLDAWIVGGAVRDRLLGRDVKDTDFVVPGVDHAGLRAALEPHGRVEDLVVAGQRVGVRLHPRDADARALAPAGIEFAPPRVERSTGPGRHDFEIVADASIPLEEDMRRRDFTINAIARRLADPEELLDPLGGRGDLARGVLRTTSPTSFRDDPLRIVRGLRFVSELDVQPDADTLAQMREWAPQVRHVSAERIGGGLAADGMGELSKLLLGARPERALLLARDTGVLTVIVPEFEPAIGYRQSSERQHLPLDEHVFAVVQAAADAGDRLTVRLAALLHDLGKPEADASGGDHAAAGARIARRVLTRLRYPIRLVEHVGRVVAAHAFWLERVDPLYVRRLLAEHGADVMRDAAAHKRADLRGKQATDEEHQVAAYAAELVERESAQPHRVTDLAVNGADLIELGYSEGPALGLALRDLLDEVVQDPARNTRDTLLGRARELLEAAPA
jgi:putative nucleotidyltransferase with HDIG domain